MNCKLMAIIAISALMIGMTTTGASSTTAFAKVPNDKFKQECEGPGQSSKEGECPGNSENSPQKKEVVRNPGGNAPPGLQEPERK